MSYGQNLRDLLSPLGVYRWDGAYQWAELQCEGMVLDQVAEVLALTRREMSLATAGHLCNGCRFCKKNPL